MKYRLTGAAMAAAMLYAGAASAQTAADVSYGTEEGVAAPTEGAEVAPLPPEGAAPGLDLPARGSDGRFTTPNTGIPPFEAVWHLRAALNVAALACRDAHEAQTVANYNALLRGKAAVLAQADTATRLGYHARYGGEWQARHDGVMTRVYNFFAQPNGQAAFCAEAQISLAAAVAADDATFTAMAPTTLARLEAPFVSFYERYDRYRVAATEWSARHSSLPQVVAATVVAAQVAPDRRGPRD